MMTLAEKVYAVIGFEPAPGHRAPIEELWTSIRRHSSSHSDLADWGFTFGVAVAIARSEDPFGSMDSVVERALIAAAEAHKRYTGDDMLASEAVA